MKQAVRREALFLIFLAVAAAAWYTAQRRGNDAAQPARRIVLTGSSTIAPLALEIGKRFEATHPGVRVDVQTGGSSRGIRDARGGLCDIGMASRELAEDEQDLAATPIARDGVCLIVHRDNPVGRIPDADAVAVYTGKIRNWSKLGGDDAGITVLNKAEGRGTLELFLHYYGLKNSQIVADAIVGDNEQAIKMVAGNPHALGYVSIGTAEYDATHGVPIRLLPVGGVDATLENVRNGSFPMSRPLNLVTRGEPAGLAAEFIAYARSAAVDNLVTAQYFVPLAHR